jgi:subtilisin-like proprotein convertase family protein
MIKKRPVRLALLACASVASLGLLAGASPASAKVKKRVVTRTASVNQCVNVSSPILSNNAAGGPAAGVATIPVTVPNFRGHPQDGVVTSLTSTSVRLSHTFDADTSLVLAAPGARVLPLSLSRGGSGDNYGSGATDCSGTLTVFTDTAPTAIGAGTPPFAGSFKPEAPLNGLVGGPARGNWTLVVTDGAGGDDGTLHAFSLNFTYTYKALVKVKKHKK